MSTTANTKQIKKPIDNSIHIILQGKGGVGKTTIALFVLQVLQRYSTSKVYGIDTDPVNQTFASFSSLGVEPVFLMDEDNEINPLKFDTLIDAILAGQDNFVIDTGATSYLPTFNYLKNTQIIDILNEQGKTTFIHVPISGGQATGDTIAELNDLASTFQNAKLVIWENQFFGKINESFYENQNFINTIKNALGVIVLQKLDPKTDGYLYAQMTSQLKSFADIINDNSQSFMTKRRISNIFDNLCEQTMEVIGKNTVNKSKQDTMQQKS